MTIYRKKNKFTIGLDFDNTLVKFRQSAIKIAAKELKIRSLPKSPRDYNFSDYPEILKNRIYKIFDDPNFSMDLIILPGVIDKLNQWKDAGHTLIIITARNEPIREATRAYIDKHFPMIDQLHFIDMCTSKADKQMELHLDVWIDDSPVDVPIAYKLGIQTFLISNSDTVYNFYLKGSPGNYNAVYDSISNINFPYALQKRKKYILQ